jgi:hypothetical protein
MNADWGGGLDVIASNVTLIYYTFVLKFDPSCLSTDTTLAQHVALILERWNFDCSAVPTPRCALLLQFNFDAAKLPAFGSTWVCCDSPWRIVLSCTSSIQAVRFSPLGPL